MEKTFFDDEFVKNIRTVLCPSCNKEFTIGLEDTEIFCDDCGEFFDVELIESYPEDFVWHPSEEY